GIRDGHVTGVQTCALPISQAGIFFKQQDHRRPDTKSRLADIDRADHWRTAHGYPRSDSRAGGTKLFAGGDADGGSAGDPSKIQGPSSSRTPIIQVPKAKRHAKPEFLVSVSMIQWI